MFERDDAGFTEAYDPGAEPGTIAEAGDEPVAEAGNEPAAEGEGEEA